MSSVKEISTEEKISELTKLLNLYETTISRQKTLADKVDRGKFKSTSVDDKVLKALVVGDVTLLTSEKDKLAKQLNDLKKGTKQSKD